MLIEEWPVELWLELFVYMSTFDLVISWFNLNIRLNRMIERALLLGLHQFDLDEIWTHETFMNCVEHVYPRLAPYVSKIILRDTFATARLVAKSSYFLPLCLNVRRLILCENVISFFPFSHHINIFKESSLLHELIIEFGLHGSNYYSNTLEKMLKNNISFHTMRFNVIDNASPYLGTNLNILHFHLGDDHGICLANTVCLTLLVQRWSNLIMLIQDGCLPLLEELDVTIEQRPSYNEQENDDDRLHSVNLFKLRSLRLCDVTLNNVRDLLRYVPSLSFKLDTLSLVRVRVDDNDNITSLHHLVDFKNLLINRLSAQLCRLQLILYIISDDTFCKHALDVFNVVDDIWPWPHMHHQTEEYIDNQNSKPIDVLYMSYPISWYSCQRRRLNDQTSVHHLRWSFQGVPPRRICWTLENEDEMSSTKATTNDIYTCLNTLVNVNSLSWFISLNPGSILAHLQQKPSIFPRWHNMHDVTLQFTNQYLLPSHRVGILDNILQSACYLTSLTAHWSDVLNVAKNNIRKYPTVKRLHLLLSFGRDWHDDVDVDVMVLLDPSVIAHLFPCLRQLSTSGDLPRGRIRLTSLDPLVSLVLSLIAHLSPHLTFLYLNKCETSLSRLVSLSKDKQKYVCDVLKMKISSAARITITDGDRLKIWL
ncbi:unnamed protein product [Rotaria sp. Silwood1]|nr:unnamed protein product [Rotaria sp. Silwood1]CAF1159113.1 unnamed protein product [Rotaria sp. Silwood1]